MTGGKVAGANAGQFIDEAVLTAVAGKGGDGLVSFRRERFAPRGGPDGGDGGRGGSIIFEACGNTGTLRDRRYQRQVRAQNGGDGGANNRHGAAGADTVLKVPVGTLVCNQGGEGGGQSEGQGGGSASVLADLTSAGARCVAARGGRGGFGNARFKSAVRQAPDFAKPGAPGETRRIRLALKLLADVGFIGLPNAGKSTLLRRVSGARPRVGAYPFTTLSPNLGVVDFGARTFVCADIPGLIAGASRGAGLGGRFLRHIERTRVLLHLLDGAALLDGARNLWDEYLNTRAELAAYDEAAAQQQITTNPWDKLCARREIVWLNKCDVLSHKQHSARAELQARLRARGCTLLCGSGATGMGVQELLTVLAAELQPRSQAVPA